MLTLLLLAACGPDVSVSKVAVDDDNDGYNVEKDCDDGRADVNPTAPELCDGRDNDCDDVVDEEATDASTFYTDADGDGSGDLNAPVEACELPEGASEVGGDCDDADGAVFPGADEVCNAVDDDCDGAFDEEAIDAVTAYWDWDGDGYGDPLTAVTGCEHPAGMVLDGTDCDDDDANVHPGASEPDCADPVDYDCDGRVAYADVDGDGSAACVDCDDADPARSPDFLEVCDGAVDEDCDSLVDDADPDVSGAPSWYRDADADGWGDAGLSTAACVAPVGTVAASGDCDDLDPARSPSLVEVCDAADLDEDCSGAADDADAGTDPATFSTFARDADGDGHGDPARTVTVCDATAGYGVDATDCDDTDATVSPSATEVCNGADDDCDTLVDDADGGVVGVSTWYLDGDGDAYGGATSVETCDPPASYVGADGDCDDAEAAVSPAAAEVCNSVDDDCDGSADEGVTTTFYADADGDGHGGSVATEACASPSGHVAMSDDCDDGSAAVSPSATEVCNDLDDDCDALVDDADPGVSGATTWYADADGDGYGAAGSSAAACDPPTAHVGDATDCDDADEDVRPGGVEVCGDGADQNCDGVDSDCGLDGAFRTTDADFVVTGALANSRFGMGLTDTIDYDGDGWPDLVAGGSVSPSSYGGVYGSLDVLTSVPSGVSTAYAIATFHAYGDGSYYTFSYGGAGLGDLDSDGDEELAWVLQRAGTPVTTLVRGRPSSSNVLLTSVDYATYTCGEVAAAGTSDALTGDDDWLCGDFLNGGADDQGSVTIYSGLATSVGTLVGEDRSDYAGHALGGGEDLDGDGYDDYVVGAMHHDAAGSSSGAVYVVYAPIASGSTFDLSAADVKIVGDGTNDYLGMQVARSPGDVDGDGYADLLTAAGADDAGGTAGGAVLLYHGPLAPSGTAASADVRVLGYSGTLIGYDPGIDMGDVDGDGSPDLLVGNYFESSAGTYGGRAWLLYGPLVGTYSLGSGDYNASFSPTRDDEYLGYFGTLTDVNHDGLEDVVLAAPLSDYRGTTNTGAIYGYYGR